VCFLERDQAAGELEEREVVLVVLRPADQDPAVSVEPGVGGLDDPAAGAPAWGADLVGDLFAAGADVRRELVRADEVADVCVVVGPVEAEALGSLRSRRRPLDRDRVERVLQEEVVVAVGALVLESDRDALRLDQDGSFRPFLARSVGFGPVFAPPRGALVIAPSAASHDQSIPTTSSYSNSPCRQISWNTPAARHSWKRRCAELDEQIPDTSNAFHCIPVRNTNKIASIALRSGTLGL
jgi:hypothetical protein